MRIHHALRHHGLLRVAEKTTDESPPLSPNTYRRRSAGSSENAPRLKRLTFDLFVACFFVCFCAVWCAAISHNASRRPCALRARVSPRCTPAPSRRARDFSALPELSPLVKLPTHTHTLIDHNTTTATVSPFESAPSMATAAVLAAHPPGTVLSPHVTWHVTWPCGHYTSTHPPPTRRRGWRVHPTTACHLGLASRAPRRVSHTAPTRLPLHSITLQYYPPRRLACSVVV